ncbi:Lysophospholipase [Marinobacter nitratireducens]|uniref:Lysophospholipase n=1 Tax=Marinobacter nitratireducens TaxID=1137280 RepID=A0A072MZW9_9GAMM|nr:alpha/beta fold hydrolase [Marinobacter nitratireducens]KEF30796.1 Lysophospholipase [Marinobacter nitratireducens]
MQEHTFTLTGLDQHLIHGVTISPTSPSAMLVIAHGMAEHSGRYTGFARWLAERGIAVTTYNHRGHGPNCGPETLGLYHQQSGWHKVTDDLHRILIDARARFPSLPLLLLGHSMGSFIAQSCIQQHPLAADALILSATNRINPFELKSSRLLIGIIRAFFGPEHRSKFLATMTFGKFNRRFRPNRTTSDWLSRDTTQVDQYLRDPLCGFECTTGLWHDFVSGMLTIDPQSWRKDLPVHLFAGTCDPVGEMGEGVRRHFQAIRNAGVEQVTLRLFEGGRHEMLNETNADEVWSYVLSLIESQAGVREYADQSQTLETA